ncbi:type II toxin-antitoxin system Phd/YefM family antitoxin [Acaryochloris sp. CCMEE 5410]|uniref:type II toxin-antitoxin system Phd/YefM family antitoxin n=1 Tax=Acaryochloris sp. CCMEE 5410 TaxID=310037 RepID=UPI000248492A|nr:type II toxin-antitoxin system Phd/YefM family antitoxin [Acaryochloris sp. CCMEE 5410]KAI9134334.1 type II toxin-antitoxin system Phd/YefM family antitoxin [Acaryochloris sp. CCMEE 5410]
MESISVNQFRAALKECVEKVISQHNPLKVTRRNGADFVVVSAEDWEREQETLHILQSSDLMQQISASFATHLNQQGYKPSTEEMDEIFSL